MRTRLPLAGLLAAAACAALLLPAGPASAQSSDPVTSEGFADLSYGKTFYLQVPMIDEPPAVTSILVPAPPQGGIGMNITAESIINSVRYAGEHPDIQHVVFMMRTGGGKMFHAEAMMHVIEEYHDANEFHIIIDDAISAGTWTVFSCDTIYIVDGGSVGGAVIYVNLPDGSVQESPEIPQVAARMAKLAERNGHNGLFLPAMMHLPAELHYWEEDGEPVLSDTAPSSPNTLQNYEVIDSATDVLTLTSDDAVMTGLAEHIEDFNAELIGEHIGTPGWKLANHYGQVIHEIADVYNVTRWDQDIVEQELANMPYFRDSRENREIPQIAAVLDRRKIFQRLLDGYEKINEALNNLPYVHPERHIYFRGEDGQTVLADPEQWAQDIRASRQYAQLLTRALRDMRSAFREAEYDDDNIGDMVEAFELISGRIEGIAREGNAAYWDENAVELDIE